MQEMDKNLHMPKKSLSRTGIVSRFFGLNILWANSVEIDYILLIFL